MCQELLAKTVNPSLEEVAQQVVHPTQRGFLHGRRMGDGIMLTLAALEHTLFLGGNTYWT